MCANHYEAQYAHAAKEILHKNYNKKITIQQIAEDVGCSGRSLRRFFKNEYGVGIGEYQVKLRMEKAKEHFEVCRSVKQVARLVGYKRPTSFSKKFLQYFGVSPSNWKNTNGTG